MHLYTCNYFNLSILAKYFHWQKMHENSMKNGSLKNIQIKMLSELGKN